MFADELRRAVEATPRENIPQVVALVWKAYSNAQITEAEAEDLTDFAETRKSPPPRNPPDRPRRSVGARPRTIASMDRRRRWAASGRLPPALAAHFTLAEQAVLALIAAEIVKQGACTLAVGHLAAVAGVSLTTVRNALREARLLCLIRVEERRVSRWRNDTNRVTIISDEWQAWLRLARQGGGGGCKSPKGTPTVDLVLGHERPSEAPRRATETVKRPPRARSVEPRCGLKRRS